MLDNYNPAQLNKYHEALKKENQSRTVEGQALQAEIERLNRKIKTHPPKSVSYSFSNNADQQTLERELRELEAKNRALEAENSSLTLQIQSSSATDSQAKGEFHWQGQLQNLKEEEQELTNRLNALERSNLLIQNQTAKLKMQGRSNQQSKMQEQENQRMLQERKNVVLSMRVQLEQKNGQIVEFQSKLKNSSKKLFQLQAQLDRVTKNSQQQKISSVSRAKVQDIQRNMQQQLRNLEQSNTGHVQQIKYLQRRIDILEETNKNIQIEIQQSQNQRMTASRAPSIQSHNDYSKQELLDIYRTVRKQLNQVKQSTQAYQQENNKLRIQLQGTPTFRPEISSQHRYPETQTYLSPLNQTSGRSSDQQRRLQEIRSKISLLKHQNKNLHQQLEFLN